MAAPTRAAERRAPLRASSERRKTSRGKVKILVAFKCLDEDAPIPSGFVRAASLSAQGALLESPDPFTVGQKLALEFLLDNNRIAPVNARVARVDKRAEYFEIGVKFSPVPLKIKRWINSQIES